MGWLPLYVAVGLAAAGIALGTAAFALTAYTGWERGMRPDARGRWPWARRLLLAGVVLTFAFALLLFVPGVVPYGTSPRPRCGRWGWSSA
jgi:hypothetical protein